MLMYPPDTHYRSHRGVGRDLEPGRRTLMGRYLCFSSETDDRRPGGSTVHQQRHGTSLALKGSQYIVRTPLITLKQSAAALHDAYIHLHATATTTRGNSRAISSAGALMSNRPSPDTRHEHPRGHSAHPGVGMARVLAGTGQADAGWRRSRRVSCASPEATSLRH
ncbi:hypothetical protein CVT26_011196 [Gymnopilus dilepis]|uniref:Uncharacterized protein n=1 Tax=Gymnopilus dilepis TaxID=231916 RepID=A0A409VJT1_9AGAR|nr:hypothetical protein CVT26_011196 [Gymnopilus dilepis]